MLTAMLTALLSAAPLADGGCELWQGSMWGNDPRVKTRLLLCRRGSELCGELDWKGQSGHNVRQLKGSVEGDAVELKDVRFKLDRPNPGWRFCLIDRYRLKLKEGTQVLEGSYFSSVCNDEAALSVERLAPSGRPAPPSCFAK